jgi:hypothetical protein
MVRLRMREAIPPTPPYVFMACYLARHRDNFTFTHIPGSYETSAVNINKLTE